MKTFEDSEQWDSKTILAYDTIKSYLIGQINSRLVFHIIDREGVEAVNNIVREFGVFATVLENGEIGWSKIND